jgi:lipoprotein-anchoring transpeptidase ErfK/SrfK
MAKTSPRPLVRSIVLVATGYLTLACGAFSAGSEPTATATAVPPTATPTATLTPAPTATREPSPTPVPQLQPGDAIIVGGTVRKRSEPSSRSSQLGLLGDQEKVEIAATVQGENWLVGAQTWVLSVPPWASEWLQLADGSFVYGAFVFVLRDGETSPIAPVPEGVEKWIDVDLSEQEARAMIGGEAVFVAPISSGAPPFPTPMGSFVVEPDGRIAVERMTASQAGYEEGQARYDVERVLFTQYFDRFGDALHVNYWRPHAVFGNTPTSHGCVGMELHEAQYFWLFAEPGTRVEIHQ